jgi:hypothetical protein
MCQVKTLKSGGTFRISDCRDVTCINSADYREIQREAGQGQDSSQTSQSGSRVGLVVKSILKKAGECGLPGVDLVRVLCEVSN